MNGRARIRTTMQHRQPDRVPVMCQLSIGHYNLNAGYKPHEIWYDTDAFADACVRMARRYAFDGILVVLPGRPANYLANALSISEAADGEWIRWRNGDRTFLPWDDMPHHYPEAALPQRANFETFDPDRDIHTVNQYLGYTWNVLYHMQEVPEDGDYLLRAFDLVKAAAGDDFSVHGSIYSPLSHYFELFGYEEALLTFLNDPSRAHAILERLSDGVIAWSRALLQRGADALDHSSAFVAAPFLSRKLYEAFVVPYERRVNRAIRDAGGVVYTHTCGRIADRLDLLEATGTMGIDTLDPPPLGNCDLGEAKRTVGQRLFLKGNMNSVALLGYRTPDEVRAEAMRALTAGKPGGGYILSTACSVAPRVEPWKLEMLTPLAEEEGRYA